MIGSNRRRLLLFLIVLVGLLLAAGALGQVVRTARAAVTLVNFETTVDNTDVIVSWETATEIDTQGFYVSRGLQATGVYTHVSPFIPAKGGSLTGGLYDYSDQNLQAGTYYYWLEAINHDQSIDLHGPISITLDALPTPTPTATNSPQAAAATATATRTPTPTRTKTPTPTPSPTHTPVPSATRGPTVTPLPTAFGIPFQTDTATQAPTLVAVPLVADTSTPTATPVPQSISALNRGPAPTQTNPPLPHTFVAMPASPTPTSVSVAMAPIVVATANADGGDAAGKASGPSLTTWGLLGLAVLLLVGGLYGILRQTGR